MRHEGRILPSLGLVGEVESIECRECRDVRPIDKLKGWRCKCGKRWSVTRMAVGISENPVGCEEMFHEQQALAWVELFRHCCDSGMRSFLGTLNGGGLARCKAWISSLTENR